MSLEIREIEAFWRLKMSGGHDAKREWVERVLGLRLDGRTNDIEARFRAAKIAWQTANDSVDSQINALAKVLRNMPDRDLQDIADNGLMSVTDGFRTKMMAALMDLGDGESGRLRKDGAKAAVFAENLRARIDADERVIACDTNRFGAPVAIRATLGPALDRIVDVLREASKSA